MTISAGTILVDNVELQEKAELAYKRIDACSMSLDRIAKAIGSSDSYWQGDAGESAREVCAAVVKESREALDELKNYPKDLLEYKNIYSEVIAHTESLVSEIADYSLE